MFNWDGQRYSEREVYVGWYVPELKWHAKLRVEKYYSNGARYQCYEYNVLEHSPPKVPGSP
jgi:hypothetical protein